MSKCPLVGFATVMAVAGFVLGAAPPAIAGPAGQFQFTFSSRQPDSSTGMTLHEVYINPNDSSAKPSPVRKTVLQLPARSVLDGHAIPECDTSDAELMLLGPAGCPAGSRIGSGTVQVVSGLGRPFDPFVSDAALFNGGTSTTEIFMAHGTGVTLQVGHDNYSNPNTLTESPAPIPGGPPDFESAPKQIDFTFGAASGPRGEPFIKTPPSCPSDGKWSALLTFTNADGHTYTLASTTPCQVTPRPHRQACARKQPARSRRRAGHARCRFSRCSKRCHRR